MDATFLPGRVDRETEFVAGLTGACGPNAAAMAERWADQSHLATLDVYHRMRAAGRCDPNGAATLAALADDARTAGYRVDVLPYREPMPESDWRGFFTAHAGHEAVVFETANGQALRDTLTGLGENARNLHYHFVLVAGWHPGGHSARASHDLPPGWWCADGDNFASGDVLQFYADDVLAAARPCAAMAVHARVTMPSSGGTSSSTGGTTVTIPTGWHDDGATLTAPNGHAVKWGFRDWVLAHAWAADNQPLEGENSLNAVEWQTPALGRGTRQIFERSALCWTQNGGVREIALGAELQAVERVLSGANATIADLRAQLAKQPPAPPPANAEAVAAVKALASALAAVK